MLVQNINKKILAFLHEHRKIAITSFQVGIFIASFSAGIMFQKYFIDNQEHTVKTQKINNTSKEKSQNNKTAQEDTNNAESQQIDSTTSETPAPYFTFIEDRSNWLTRKSKDDSYSIMFGPNETFGYCDNDNTTMLVGMIWMESDFNYSCNSVTSALAPSNPRLTRIAFGVLNDNQEFHASVEKEVSLSDGTLAKYYEYATEENGLNYNVVEYRVKNTKATYLARLKYDKGYNLNEGSNMSVGYFNTIVQKTWEIYNQ